MKEPEWLSEVSPNSGLSAKDVMQIFGYGSTAALHNAIRDGRMPEPDGRTDESKGYNFIPIARKRIWTVKAIRAEIRRRNALDSLKQTV